MITNFYKTFLIPNSRISLFIGVIINKITIYIEIKIIGLTNRNLSFNKSYRKKYFHLFGVYLPIYK